LYDTATLVQALVSSQQRAVQAVQAASAALARAVEAALPGFICFQCKK
jgi:N-acetylmuramic acid 6-phosphate (MurNAc-6-P) etherase